ncbi:type I polyketide synthase [Chryseolinea lacunae]|uniref:SDR family NAD(P)-dependent oxidoreductase n=1 Tax=Chryseolinea lacunae TaxID=2801331 RepID=A0ABS1KUC9_9BACT|nr:type I polyketide synthase [Chryseolinea lacunae]MBL0743056.1 SDR family NAD(P)-dependent oxidoreductase [Chryseolinea lacunae]
MKEEHEIRSWLLEKLSDILGIDRNQISIHKRFKEYGLDSKNATLLIHKLSAWLSRPLEQTLVWDYPTLQELIAHLISKKSGPAPSTQTRPRDYTPVTHEPIAIVGMACRFPNAADKNAYWELLKNGLSGIVNVPADRWDADEFYDSDNTQAGKMNTRWGGFLEQVDKFDPEFFGITPKEAVQIDPQQRLMLELSWEAFEDLGVVPASLKDSKTGVFYSAIWNDYLILNSRNGPNNIVQHTATGLHHSIIANRVSYTFGLRGPSLTIDTACSSGLVTVHLAMQSIRRGECDMALAGGVNLILTPESTIAMAKFGAMAPDGQSKAFDSRANGYVRGEGGGVVVLKPLSKALRDGDRIYATVLESAVNNDGFSNGLTAPNPKAQEEALSEAYERAGVEPHKVHFVETHGTGTILGDPIEAKALGKILSANRNDDNALLLGSVKTNIGHLEGAAGIAGLIKVALAIEHRQIPQNLNFESPNPNISFNELKLSVPKTLTPWPELGKPALAGVSSFGFGGTNCHVVLQGEAQSRLQALLTLSSTTHEELQNLMKATLTLVQAEKTLTLSEFCFAINSRVSLAAHRRAFTADTFEDLAMQLTTALGGEPFAEKTDINSTVPPIAFVCSGQGSQWIGMGLSLLQHEPVFRSKIKQCDALGKTFYGVSVLEELTAGASAKQTPIEIIQPLIFSIQVGLAALWESWGIRPNVVIGHSMGEVAAAHIAGVLTLRDAMKIICVRSRLLSNVAGKGSMAVVELNSDALAPILAPYGDSVSIAAYNSPVSTVLSGDTTAVAAIVDQLNTANIYCKQINVDVASHSAQMDSLRKELLEALSDITPLPAHIPIVSTVHGKRLGYEQFNSTYWVHNLRKPVRFFQGIGVLAGEQDHLFIELSPHPILSKSISETLDNKEKNAWIKSTLERNEDARKTMLATLSAACEAGHDVDWNTIYARTSRHEAPSSLEPWLAIPPASGKPSRWNIFPLSAHTPEALIDYTKTFQKQAAHGAFNMTDAAHAAGVKRMHHPCRLGVVSDSPVHLLQVLGDSVQKRVNAFAMPGRTKTHQQQNLVFVFSGQGAQWLGMARELFAQEEVFRNVIKQCERLLKAESAGWSLINKITEDRQWVDHNETEFAQPIIFSIQIALAELWKSWGIVPSAVVGHSMGEVAAACVAGVLTLNDAIKIIYHRGKTMQEIKGHGAMAIVYHDPATVNGNLPASEFGSDVSIAAYNSHANTLISGKHDRLAMAVARLKSKGLAVKDFSRDYAFHSPLMQACSETMEAHMGSVESHMHAVPIYSTLTGDVRDGLEFGADYWVQNVVSPVRFAAAMESLLRDQFNVFLEIGPHPVLSSPITQVLEASGKEAVVLTSLKRDESAHKTMYTALAKLYAIGFDVNWENLYPQGAHRCDLPKFPFQRKRYWLTDNNRSTTTPQPETPSTKQLPDKTVDNLLYDVFWKINDDDAALPETDLTKDQPWILLADRSGFADRLMQQLAQHDRPYILVEQNDRYQQVDPFHYRIDPANASHCEKLATDIIRHPSMVVKGLVNLWCLDGTSLPGDFSGDELCSEYMRTCQSVIHLFNAFSTYRKNDLHFFIISRATQHVVDTEQNLRVQHATLWGLGRTLGLENPRIKFKNIDLDVDNDETNVVRLRDELCHVSKEDRIAYRNSERFVMRMVKSAAPASITSGLVCDAQKAYVVVGGLGGLGLQTAEWLIRKGARHLVLVTKSGVIGDQESFSRLVSHTVNIQVRKADVAKRHEIEAVFNTLDREVGGVVHAAGTAQLKMAQDQSEDEFSAMLLPKTVGTWNLHQLTKEMRLEFFICFSSISSLTGSKQMSGYAAANAFLDGFAHYRKSCGLPCLCINWGPVGKLGMVAKLKDVFDESFMAKVGLRLLDVAAIPQILDRLAVQRARQAVAMDCDVRKLFQVFSQTTAMFNDFPAPQAADAEEDVTPLSQQIRILPEDKSRALIVHNLQLITESVLGICALDIDRNLLDTGMDSLMAIEFIKMVQEKFQVKMETSIVYTRSTLRELTNAIFEKMFPAQVLENISVNIN